MSVERVSIPRGDKADTARPIWYQWGEQTFVRCGACGTTLALNHKVDDGNVSPSIVCPIGGCNWHVFARLEGYG